MTTPVPTGPNGTPLHGLLHLHTTRRGRWAIVTVQGELDIATETQLAVQLRPLIASDQAASIALEVSGLAFCDSSGLNLLLRTSRQLTSAGGRLLLVRPTQPLVKLLRLTGLTGRLETADELPSVR